MGPRRFQRGYYVLPLHAFPGLLWLQWGHAVSSVDTLHHPVLRVVQGQPCFNGATPFPAWIRVVSASRSTIVSPLQWGHAVSSVDTQDLLSQNNALPLLQWGHAVSSVDTIAIVALLTAGVTASMGPRRFQRGYWDVALRRVGLHQGSFNGATPFPAWIPPLVRCTCPSTRRFNGATPFPAWIREPPVERRHHVQSASMGPRRFQRGYANEVLGRHHKATLRMLQWGHAVSSVDTFASNGATNMVVKLQWGHAVSSVDTTATW